jgi:hypothetical protein
MADETAGELEATHQSTQSWVRVFDGALFSTESLFIESFF